MSTASESVYPNRRRRAIANQLFDPAWGPLSIEELMFLQTTRAVDLVDQATDHSLAAIRARGLDPDPDLVPSKYDSDPDEEAWEDVDPYP